MKKITCFYLTHCPYCIQARRAIDELKKEQRAYMPLEIEWVEESENPAAADSYDYYYTPSMFIGMEKIYEAQPGESYRQCKEQIQKVFDRALR